MNNIVEAVDVLVETHNPEALDRTVMALGPIALVGAPNYTRHDGYFVMRIFVNVDLYIKMIEAQGYCKIIRKLDDLL